ncbi:helix-turn-helix transcriptional regulator [Brevundimonas sp.]|uniref:PadR family transcriptional regulator n=1 Tax=Brevundimonas sp. TaxID=1871086 RepID=UPI001A2FCCD9|nr:helix-turn-helix transcriptional regulator [Brevundimonas sp.]MBJ7485079.1 helix-turn-helix transcriptional regulator [Brevundimonas sp.]
MTISARKLSPQTLSVLSALAEAGSAWRYGLQISQSTALKSGSLYPILARLNERGLIEGEWLEPERPGRPPRHAYRLTAEGRRFVSEQPASAADALSADLAGAAA